MATSYSKLIHTTLASCQQGSKKSIQLTSWKPGSAFRESAKMLMDSRLSFIDKLFIRQHYLALRQGLVTARQGQLIKAEQHFTAAQKFLQSNQFSPEGDLICQSFQQTAQAYLDYRRGDFNQARTRTLEALAIDTALEEDYNFHLLGHSHRLELAGNLIRIDSRWMQWQRAVELAGQLLSYLEGVLEELPLSGSWSSKQVLLLPVESALGIFLAVTSEVALMLAGKNRQVACELFEIMAYPMELPANQNRCLHPRVHSWFLLKQAFVKGDTTTFLEQASHFLAEGRGDIPLLWYGTVVDLVTLCDQLALPNSELVRQDIARNAATWEKLPKSFFPLLGVLEKSNSYNKLKSCSHP